MPHMICHAYYLLLKQKQNFTYICTITGYFSISMILVTYSKVLLFPSVSITVLACFRIMF